MARPQKEGLDYFPVDVDMDRDDKIELIEAKFGITGFAIIIKLLMKIYKEGYFYEWTEKEQLLFSRRVNVDINLINDVVNECVKWKLFNKELFEKYKILTSKGVQERYFEATSRRKKVEIIKEYCLIDTTKFSNIVIVDINKINVDINLDNADINPQSKVKESKENIIDDDAREKSIETNEVPVEVSADLTQQEQDGPDADSDLIKEPSADLGQKLGAVPSSEGEKALSRIEMYYANNVLKRNTISSKDIKAILETYEKGYPVDFILKCINIGCERYKKSNGELNIKSFKYFIPIIEEEWEKRKLKEDAAKIQPQKLESIKSNKTYGNRRLTRFHNFEQRTSKYTAEELEQIIRKNFEEKMRKKQEQVAQK